MSINTMKTIKNCEGHINKRYSMCISDFLTIHENSKDIFDMIYNAFTFGYAQGSKATRKELAK